MFNEKKQLSNSNKGWLTIRPGISPSSEVSRAKLLSKVFSLSHGSMTKASLLYLRRPAVPSRSALHTYSHLRARSCYIRDIFLFFNNKCQSKKESFENSFSLSWETCFVCIAILHYFYSKEYLPPKVIARPSETIVLIAASQGTVGRCKLRNCSAHSWTQFW